MKKQNKLEEKKEGMAKKMKLPKHLQDIADSPKAQKIYKEAQEKKGKKIGYIK